MLSFVIRKRGENVDIHFSESVKEIRGFEKDSILSMLNSFCLIIRNT